MWNKHEPRKQWCSGSLLTGLYNSCNRWRNSYLCLFCKIRKVAPAKRTSLLAGEPYRKSGLWHLKNFRVISPQRKWEVVIWRPDSESGETKTLCEHPAKVKGEIASCSVVPDSLDRSPPGSSVHGILQAITLERVAVPSSRGSSQPRDGSWVSCPAGAASALSHQGSPSQSLPFSNQSCGILRFCLPNCFSRIQLFATPWTAARQVSLSMGFLKARILEWVAISSSRGSSWPRDRTHLSYVSCICRWVVLH